jgi:AcrR family transcriptional regulator
MRNRKSENAKEKILLAATRLFMRYGYGQMSVDDLASDLHMSKKTIYRHYPSKADLMDAVIEAFFANLNAELSALIASEKPYPEKLQAFLKTISITLAGASQLLIAELATGIPDVWKKTRVLRKNTIEIQATKLIQIGINEDIVRADIDTELFLLVVLVSLEQAADPQRLIQIGQSFDRVFEQVMDIVFTGILKR